MHDVIHEQGVTPRRRSSDSTHSTARRTRLVFFSLAALWGYVLGIAVLAAALSISGRRPLAFEASLVPWLAAGSVLGVTGGLVAAGAYREARRRAH